MIVKRKSIDSIENQLSAFEDEFRELKNELSNIRKRGRDTAIAELFFYDFIPLMRMAKATYDEYDIKKIRELLDRIKVELEISNNGGDFEHITHMISDCYEYVRQKQFDEASVVYSKMMVIYKRLPKELQTLVYYACKDLHDKIITKESLLI